MVAVNAAKRLFMSHGIGREEGRIIKSFAMPRQTLVIFLCMERISGGSEKNLHLLLQHVEYFIFLKIEQKTSLVNLEAEQKLCLFWRISVSELRILCTFDNAV